MKSKSFPFFLFCTSLGFLGVSMIAESPFFAGEPGQENATTQVWSLPEMDPIPQTDAWENNDTPLSEEEQKAFQKRWLEISAEVYLFITPELVRQLSRWNRDRMKCYEKTDPTPADRVFWKPTKRDETGKRVLLYTPLEPLPSTRPMRRDLTIFALYNTETQNIDWMLVTIHGEVPSGWRKFL
ncbi:MAG: hypothetical protein Q4D98_13345 [Planctomycetia bacterium]|nr:hypothetical protein [Planctomycetia bacterium]